MTKYYFLLLSLLSLNCFSQGFSSYASGIRVGNTIYNITGSGFQQVNPNPDAVAFEGASLGTFSPSSSCGRITAAEIKTWKNVTGNVCSATLHWRVYATSAIPGSFNAVSLNDITDCNTITNVYNDNVGACSPGDQKWKDYNLSADFLNGLTAGTYTLEVYLDFTGSDSSPSTCETTKFISNGGANYKATFSISPTDANPVISSASVCEGNSVTLTANPSGGTAPYTYSWTGPNGYASNAQNPVINNVSATNAGAYNLIVTDACGVSSVVKSTASLGVVTRITPTFDAILPAICNGSTPPLLSNSSTNGITGTWNPPVVSNTSTATYVFTPDATFCANTVSQTIFVVNNVLPNFNFPTNFCYGSTPPALPAVSANGIVGTWNPAVMSTTTTGTYTFTPNAGQCALVRTITTTLTVNNAVFDPVAPFCQGTTPIPVLASTSNNGITGTWYPAVISNQVSGSYTFTPNPGQCAPPFTLSVTVIPLEHPVFDPIPPICEGSTPPSLPGTSTNGISGTWNPAVINTAATTTYTFTADAPICADPVDLTVEVQPVITPVFDPFLPICEGEAAPVLPAVSTNGITGTWNPAVVSNTASGVYTFTPDGTVCADPYVLNFTVNLKTQPVFPSFPTICSGGTVPLLPTTSNNGIIGTWSPATVSNTANGNYTFTPDAGQCALPLTVTILVQDNIAPQFDTISTFCKNTTAPVLVTTSNNGITGTWNPAVISNTASGTYTFTPDAGQCALEATINVTVMPVVMPSFTLPAVICENDPSPVLAAVSDNNISGTWSPAIVSNTVSGDYTFTPDAGQCANVQTFHIDVFPKVIPIFDAIPAICSGSNAPALQAISNNGISGTWNPAVISNTAGGTYTFTPDAGQCAFTSTLNVDVIDTVTPIFDAIAPFCENTTAPVLATTSNNGVTGTWSPAVISNTASGTYTFTPDAGQCGATFAFNVNVLPVLTPSFSIPAVICENDEVPLLPQLSNNNVAGTWSPSIVSNTASGTYTFTPNADQCAVPATYMITVSPVITPEFDIIPSICTGTTAPMLQAVSNNGITGLWNPSTISNAASGTYTFTPDAGQCAMPVSITVNVSDPITPEFDAIAPICANGTVPALELLSNNGVMGTWNPATISNTASGTYTFTPDAGECAVPTSIFITINPFVTPSFTIADPICANTSVSTLPTVSNDGYTGTWNPPVIDNTATTVYTFTPDAGQCALPFVTTITVNDVVVPVFDPIAPICANSTIPANVIPVPVLPATSNNGITGTWNPAVIDPMTSGTYTFTPNAGQCATAVTINVTVLDVVVPVFAAVTPICLGSTAPVLPAVSDNGVPGTWSPAVIDNMASGTYVFTPDAGQCSQVISLNVTVNPIITPTFSLPAAFCAGDTVPSLPPSSVEGLTGTWSPAIIDNMTSGTYTFTPDAGQCGMAITISITVNPVTTPVFTPVAPVCPTAATPVLPLVSNNGITGSWSPAVVSLTASDTYTFTPDAGQCAVQATMLITVLPVAVPAFPALGPICTSEPVPTLPVVSNNGISGTWSPAVLNNIYSAVYTFTPDTGQCAQPVEIYFVVNDGTLPTFNAIAPVCKNGTVPTLPIISNNGITGTWTPAVIDNTASGVYNFTPDPGQCAVVAGLTVTVINPVTPVFSIPDICAGSTATLPVSSNNGISGIWMPSVVDNNATADYVFTPDAGECALPVTVTVHVNPTVATLFDQVAPVCPGSTAPVLSTTSTNGITGTWSPSNVDTFNSATYTFTPDGGQCGTVVTMDITVYNAPTDIAITVNDVESNAGSIVINSVSGGTAPFEYSINEGTYSNNTQFNNLEGGDYTVTVRDANGCTFSKMANIAATCKLPKGISPNNDGDNDTFKTLGCTIVKLEIYNRYGTKVNSFSNYHDTWDGTSSDGALLPSGTYFYEAEMQGGGSKTGWVYLLR